MDLEELDSILIRAVILIPDREFYHEFIKNAHFEAVRTEIRLLRDKVNSTFYRAERVVRSRLKRHVRAYQEELHCEVAEIKQEIVEDLLLHDRTYKELYLEEVISKHRLLPYLKGDYYGIYKESDHG